MNEGMRALPEASNWNVKGLCFFMSIALAIPCALKPIRFDYEMQQSLK